jgi:hypothetical protein
MGPSWGGGAIGVESDVESVEVWDGRDGTDGRDGPVGKVLLLVVGGGERDRLVGNVCCAAFGWSRGEDAMMTNTGARDGRCSASRE